MHQLVLFDLGDSLFYRDTPLIDFDTCLLEKYVHKDPSLIKVILQKEAILHPGIYTFNKEPQKSLRSEDFHAQYFFKTIFSKLDVKNENMLKEFLESRNTEKRYHLFPRTKKLLGDLLSKNYVLGVLSNGRPSRRRVMKQLNILNYFDPKYIFISDEIGVSKPSFDIFDYVNNTTGFHNYCLCDDEQRNLDPAYKSGWTPILIDHKNNDGYDRVYKLLINDENL